MIQNHIEENKEYELVSVLIPSFNHRRFITACLDSVANETYPNIEIIVLDDGSTDGSFEVITEWRRAHLGKLTDILVSEQANAGLAVTLNRLILQSKGEFIVPLASDDMLKPGGIEVRLRELKNNPNLAVVFGDADVIDENGKQILKSAISNYRRASKISLANKNTINLELIWRWSLPGPVLMVRRDTFFSDSGIGLYPEGVSVEDRHFYLKALSLNALGFIDFAVSSYRIHKGQTINSLKDKRRAEILESEEYFSKVFGGFSGVSLWLLSRGKYFPRRGAVSRLISNMADFILLLFGYSIVSLNTIFAIILHLCAQLRGPRPVMANEP